MRAGSDCCRGRRLLRGNANTTISYISTITELQTLRANLVAANPNRPYISVCGGTGCRVYGSEKIWNALRDELTRQRVNAALDYDIKVTGCHGFCEKGPLVVLRPQGTLYTHVQVDDVPAIVSETIIGGKIIPCLLYTDPQTGQAIEHEHDPGSRRATRT